MGLLDDLRATQPMVDSFAKQLGLYQDVSRRNKIEQRTQDILDETYSELNKQTGEKDTLATVMADPMKYFPIAQKAISQLAPINPKAAESIGQIWDNAIQSMNAGSSRISADASAKNANTSAEQFGLQKTQAEDAKALRQKKVYDVFKLKPGEPFEVEVGMGKTKKRLDVSQMTLEEAEAAGAILKPFLEGETANKQLQANLGLSVAQLKGSLKGVFNDAYRTVDAKNELPDDAYFTLMGELSRELETKGVDFSQEIAVNNTLKKLGKQLQDTQKAKRMLTDIAGRTFSASRDVYAKTVSNEKNVDKRLTSQEEANILKGWQKLDYIQVAKDWGGTPPTLKQYRARYIETGGKPTGKMGIDELLDAYDKGQ